MVGTQTRGIPRFEVPPMTGKMKLPDHSRTFLIKLLQWIREPFYFMCLLHKKRVYLSFDV